MRKEDINVKMLIITALWLAIVTVVTMAVAIPIPLTQGYVNLGDCAVFLGVFLLGTRNGVIAAGLGAALADIIVGYVSFAPFTLVIKVLMALVFGLCLKVSEGKVSKDAKKFPMSRIIGVILSTGILTGGYYLAEWAITGNKTAPIVAIPWNILQGLIGGAIALVLMAALGSLRLPKFMTSSNQTDVQAEKPESAISVDAAAPETLEAGVVETEDMLSAGESSEAAQAVDTAPYADEATDKTEVE